MRHVERLGSVVVDYLDYYCTVLNHERTRHLNLLPRIRLTGVYNGTRARSGRNAVEQRACGKREWRVLIGWPGRASEESEESWLRRGLRRGLDGHHRRVGCGG
jgi:hypothetical protein